MKNIIVGALLTSAFALQNASAEIRTFEFTAQISTLTLNYYDASSLAGIDAGTTITIGDSVVGRFSFDDEGRDFVGASTPYSSENVKFIEFSIPISNTKIELDDLTSWSHNPNIAASSSFMLSGIDTERMVAGGVTVFSPRYAFEWELDDDTQGFFGFRWNLDNGVGRVNADMTSLIEVSAVPEPASYAMLLLGAAVIGGVFKRRAGQYAS